MKKENSDPVFLQVLYLVIFFVLFGLIVYVPHAIKNPLQITEKIIIEEELIESVLLSVLLLLNVLIYNLYKKEAARQKELVAKMKNDNKSIHEKLDESFRYIGQVNVQIQQIKSIFSSSDRFPKTKNDFKKTLVFYSERIFGIVNINWVLFRIINSTTGRTISEQFETRHGLPQEYPHISNKLILERQACHPYTTIVENPQDLNITVSCTLPVENITGEEQVFIQAITNEITMIFIYFNSTYYKETASQPALENADN
jgi:hypothetical protein